MARFIHTADWHIGLRARHAGTKAATLRAQRIESANRIFTLANEDKVDFILIAGDLFDSPDVERETVADIAAMLSESPVPVCVIPGNHDPLIPMSVWESDAWRNRSETVRFLAESTPIEINVGVTLYPCPVFQKTSIVDPTEWIPAREEGDDSIRIGLAHGSLQILDERTPMDFPIATARAKRAGLDYLALGDWHGTRVVGSTAYPGTHEQTSFSDKDSGNVLVVDIAGAGAVPIIKAQRIGGCVWKRLDLTVRDQTDVSALQSEIKQLGELSKLCLNIKLKIPTDIEPEARAALDRLKTELENCLWLQWTDDAFSNEEAIDRIPDGYLREVYGSLDLPAALGLTSETAANAQEWMREIAMKGLR